MVDILSISTLIVAGLGALGACMATIHLRKCNIFGKCIESDCRKRTPPPTPSEPIEETSIA